MPLFSKTQEQVPCTVEVSHRFDSLHAHVRFNNGAVVHPGDEALVDGAPVMAAYGGVIVEDRAGHHHPRQRAGTLAGPGRPATLSSWSFANSLVQ